MDLADTYRLSTYPAPSRIVRLQTSRRLSQCLARIPASRPGSAPCRFPPTASFNAFLKALALLRINSWRTATRLLVTISRRTGSLAADRLTVSNKAKSSSLPMNSSRHSRTAPTTVSSPRVRESRGFTPPSFTHNRTTYRQAPACRAISLHITSRQVKP